tara:strand:- start:7495 stop:8703 length:1209 start_codon:yes stop_codon:yes gene_type:complete
MSSAVPQGWKEKTLGQVSTLIMGQSPSSSTYNFDGEGLPFYQGKADFGSHHPVTRVWCSEPTKIAPENSILFSVRAPVGDVNVTKDECCIGRGLAAVIGKQVNQSYLYQNLTFMKPKFELLAQGSTFEAVNGGEMREFQLIIPPIPEQKKIASILTSVDEVIEKTESQIAKLQDLKTGMMQELLTKGIGHTEFKDSPVGRIPVEWDHTSLGEVTVKSAFGPRFSSGEYSPSGNIGCIRTTDMDENWDIDYSKAPLAELDYAEFESHFLEEGDLLVTRSGTCGLVDVFRKQPAPMVAAAFLIKFTLNSDVNPWFVRYAMMTSHIQSEVQLLASGGVQKNLSGTSLKTLFIPKPPIEEQNRIVAAIESLNHQKTVVRNRKEKLIAIKAGLMQDLLTGKVRVKTD